MSDILKRIDEHLEFHRSIDSHKSDVAFLEAVKSSITKLKQELLIAENALSNANKALGGVRKHVTAVDMRPGDKANEIDKSNGEG